MVIINHNSNLEELEKSKCFVVKYTNNKELSAILHKIKKSASVEVYAKPILLLNELEQNIDTYYKNCVDKVIDLEYFNKEQYYNDTFIYNINSKITLLKHLDEKKESDLAFKVLRYIYTRDMSLTPYPNIYSKYGYSYPKIDHILDDNKDKKSKKGLFRILDFLVEQHMLEATFFDRAHYCPECCSAFINFKEVCPKCNNVNIKEEALLHHFECAYVGKESEFKHGNKKVCPKCDKELMRIGVDYDKPSSVYSCSKCQNSFQEPIVKGSCFNCNHTFNIENFLLREISSYEYTILTENSAIFGFQNIFSNILDTELSMLNKSSFNKYIEIELNRTVRYKKTISTLISLNLSDINKIYSDINKLETIKKTFKELSKIINDFLRTTDIISSFNDVMYGILLLETPFEGAKIATDRLKEEIEELIRINIHKDYEIQIDLKEITQNDSFDDLMGFFKN